MNERKNERARTDASVAEFTCPLAVVKLARCVRLKLNLNLNLNLNLKANF